MSKPKPDSSSIKRFAQVHRFRDKVAVYLDGNETVYLSADVALKVGLAMVACSKDITNEPSFAASTFRTQTIDLPRSQD